MELAMAGPEPEVILEATYGWYWAADCFAANGHRAPGAPSATTGATGGSKNDERDATDLADLLRLGRLAEAWIAPPEVRELRRCATERRGAW